MPLIGAKSTGTKARTDGHAAVPAVAPQPTPLDNLMNMGL
jgi:hypothetical protein